VNGTAEGTGRAPDSALPVPVLLLTAALAAAGITGGLLAERTISGAVTTPFWPAVVTFLALLTVVFPTLQFQWRDQGDAFDLFEAVLVPTVFVLPPLTAVLVVGVALASSEIIQRIHPVKAAFNVAQWMAATAAGSIVLAAFRDGGDRATLRDIVVLVAAMIVIMVVNDLALIAVLWLSGPQPLGDVLRGVKPLLPVWLIGGAMNLAFGLLFVAA
jgi:hypothetical protein